MELNNATNPLIICREDLVTMASDIIASTVNLILSIGGSFLNLLVCVTILTSTRFRSSCYLFMLSPAASDLLITAIVQPILVYTTIDGFGGQCFTKLVRGMSLVTAINLAVSLQTLTWISLDRCLAALSPFRHNIILSSKRGKLIIVKTWLVAVFVCILAGFRILSHEVVQRLAMAALFACYIIMIASYGLIWNSVRKQRRILSENCRVHGKTTKTEKRLATNSALIVGLFTLSWVPMEFVILNREKGDYTRRPARNWAFTGGLASATIDSAVYFYRNKDMRDSARKILKRLQNCMLSVYQAEVQS